MDMGAGLGMSISFSFFKRTGLNCSGAAGGSSLGFAALDREVSVLY